MDLNSVMIYKHCTSNIITPSHCQRIPLTQKMVLYNLYTHKFMLGVVYTMDHEVVPRPYKICDWMLNSSQDHFGLREGNNVSDHGVRGLHNTYFKGLHYPLTWSTMFCGGRGKRGALEKGTWQRNVVIMDFTFIFYFFWGGRGDN